MDSSAFHLCLSFSIIWAVLYAIRHRLNVRNQPSSFLPTPVSSGRRTHSDSAETLYKSTSTHITLQNFHLRIESSIFNDAHERLCSLLKNKNLRRAKSLLNSFYDIGIVWGVIGMVGIILLLVGSVVSLVAILYNRHFGAAEMLGKIGKRDMQVFNDPEPLLQPLIPGVTVPMSHLPMLIAAIFISQSFHEFGHAIAAALTSVPLSSVGASFLVFVSTAFVVLPGTAVSVLPRRARLRVVSAGVWHNLVFFLLLFILPRIALVRSTIEALTGYENISARGRAINYVDTDSPLFMHLPMGTLVTKVDDIPLAGVENVWETYLNEQEGSRAKSRLGWCIDASTYSSSPGECCKSLASQNSSTTNSLACFTSTSSPFEHRCIDPVSILTSMTAMRCSPDVGCGIPQASCIRPLASNGLLRLTIIKPEQESEEIILWNGPKREVLEQVRVGTHFAKGFFSFDFLTATTQLIEYIGMANLSLYFFNMLPLAPLDGAQVISELLDWLQGDMAHRRDLESGFSAATRRPRISATWWKKTIRYCVITLLCAFAALSALSMWESTS